MRNTTPHDAEYVTDIMVLKYDRDTLGLGKDYMIFDIFYAK